MTPEEYKIATGFDPRAAVPMREHVSSVPDLFDAVRSMWRKLGEQNHYKNNYESYARADVANTELLQRLIAPPLTPEDVKRLILMEGYKVPNNIDREVAKRIEEQTTEKEVARKLQIIQTYGDDRYADTDVIRFRKTYTLGDGSYKEYVYAAIKAGGKWYVTGPTQAGKCYTWSELCLFLVSDNPVDALDVEYMIPMYAPRPPQGEAAQIDHPV